MTKFEVLIDIIAGNKRKQNSELDSDGNLEVARSESSKTPGTKC